MLLDAARLALHLSAPLLAPLPAALLADPLLPRMGCFRQVISLVGDCGVDSSFKGFGLDGQRGKINKDLPTRESSLYGLVV